MPGNRYAERHEAEVLRCLEVLERFLELLDDCNDAEDEAQEHRHWVVQGFGVKSQNVFGLQVNRNCRQARVPRVARFEVQPHFQSLRVEEVLQVCEVGVYYYIYVTGHHFALPKVLYSHEFGLDRIYFQVTWFSLVVCYFYVFWRVEAVKLRVEGELDN